MARAPIRRRLARWLGETAKLAGAAGLAIAVASFLIRHETDSDRTARGRFSHLPSAAALAQGYEVKDLSARGLAYIIAGLGAGALMLIGIVFLMIALFTSWDRQENAGRTPQQTALLIAPAPHLQRDPIGDLRRETAREQHALEGYAWLDAQHTQAHIPIERAMALLAGQPLDPAP